SREAFVPSCGIGCYRLRRDPSRGRECHGRWSAPQPCLLGSLIRLPAAVLQLCRSLQHRACIIFRSLHIPHRKQAISKRAIAIALCDGGWAPVHALPCYIRTSRLLLPSCLSLSPC
ncbi:unnamed protein product, partial [Laminaria digitata]